LGESRGWPVTGQCKGGFQVIKSREVKLRQSERIKEGVSENLKDLRQNHCSCKQVLRNDDHLATVKSHQSRLSSRLMSSAIFGSSLLLKPGLPDGFFSNQESQFG
jgi:hypothetical protein